MRGVPKENISKENTSKNTGQNLRSIMGLRAFRDSQRLFLISFAATRALMTLRREESRWAEEHAIQLAPEDRKIVSLISIMPPNGIAPLTAENWDETEMGRNIVMAEVNKLNPALPSDPKKETNYIRLGHCEDTDLRKEADRADKLLRHLPSKQVRKYGADPTPGPR